MYTSAIYASSVSSLLCTLFHDACCVLTPTAYLIKSIRISRVLSGDMKHTQTYLATLMEAVLSRGKRAVRNYSPHLIICDLLFVYYERIYLLFCVTASREEPHEGRTIYIYIYIYTGWLERVFSGVYQRCKLQMRALSCDCDCYAILRLYTNAERQMFSAYARPSAGHGLSPSHRLEDA